MQRRMTCQIPTDVMEPTITKGSTIAVDTSYYYNNQPERWDVVVFTAPEIEQMQFDLGQKKIDNCPSKAIVNAAADIYTEQQILLRPHVFYVKRIMGLPGERIRFTESHILCDGKELHIPRDIQRCYSAFKSYENYQFGAIEYLVPENCVYVLSDNLAKGKDSRHIGAISLHNMTGRVIL